MYDDVTIKKTHTQTMKCASMPLYHQITLSKTMHELAQTAVTKDTLYNDMIKQRQQHPMKRQHSIFNIYQSKFLQKWQLLLTNKKPKNTPAIRYHDRCNQLRYNKVVKILQQQATYVLQLEFNCQWKTGRRGNLATETQRRTLTEVGKYRSQREMLSSHYTYRMEIMIERCRIQRIARVISTQKLAQTQC